MIYWTIQNPEEERIFLEVPARPPDGLSSRLVAGASAGKRAATDSRRPRRQGLSARGRWQGRVQRRPRHGRRGGRLPRKRQVLLKRLQDKRDEERMHKVGSAMSEFFKLNPSFGQHTMMETAGASRHSTLSAGQLGDPRRDHDLFLRARPVVNRAAGELVAQKKMKQSDQGRRGRPRACAQDSS